MIAIVKRLAGFSAFSLVFGLGIGCQAALGELEFTVRDKESHQPVAASVQLTSSRGRRVRPRGVRAYGNSFVVPGTLVMQLAPGQYSFVVRRGPEYRIVSGNFTIESGATDNKQVEIQRFVDMKKKGWWSGDLHVELPTQEMSTLLEAEDLHIAPVITWSNTSNRWQDHAIPANLLNRNNEDRYFHLMAGRDGRPSAALLYFGRKTPWEFSSSTNRGQGVISTLIQLGDDPGIHVDVHRPSPWDLPLWIASGKVDTIELANANLQQERVADSMEEGKPRDRRRFPPPQGSARWFELIYYRLLDVGVRLPPSAGSGAGSNSNPIGYNRVYVFCGPDLDYETWWKNLRRGQVVVTNGPLMQPRVNGRLPGHVFSSSAGEEIELETTLDLATQDKIDYLEIVKNGDVVASIRLDKWAAAHGRLPKVSFRESGWLLIRAITTNQDTYRFATSGPFYVEFDSQPRISRESAQFFLGWLDERIRQVAQKKPADDPTLLRYYQAARESWVRRVNQANAP